MVVIPKWTNVNLQQGQHGQSIIFQFQRPVQLVVLTHAMLWHSYNQTHGHGLVLMLSFLKNSNDIQ